VNGKNLINEKTYTLEELCIALKERGRNVTKTMLKNYIKIGNLKAIKVDGELIVKESDIDWDIHLIGPPDYKDSEDSFKDWENRNQGIDQDQKISLSENPSKFACTICGCELPKKNFRYNERGYAFCRTCYSEIH